MFDRRTLLTSGSCAAVAGIFPQAVWSRTASSLGNQLYADVMHYSGLGHHRTGGEGDNATTQWLGERLAKAGYDVSTPGFNLATFEPDQCSIHIGDDRIAGFPAWPVVPTCGTGGSLTNAGEPGSLVDKIALVVLPYRPGSAFVVRGFGSAVIDAQSRGAAAIIVVTQGPTGEIIALNAHLERYAWRVPVVLVGGKESRRLEDLAAARTSVTVETRGTVQPKVHATNLLARRPALPGAPSGSIILTTPKSGWFTCAGERGSGIALFLMLAKDLVKWTRREIMVVATSGHELEGLGGESLLEHYAPPPEQVALWTHVGANIASNVPDLTAGVRRTNAIEDRRGILVPQRLMAPAIRAFVRQPGYEKPVDILSDKAVGEVVIYRREGYQNLIGLVGAHALHHTQLDLPGNVTSPLALEPVAQGLRRLLATQVR